MHSEPALQFKFFPESIFGIFPCAIRSTVWQVQVLDLLVAFFQVRSALVCFSKFLLFLTLFGKCLFARSMKYSFIPITFGLILFLSIPRCFVEEVKLML